MEKLSVKMGWLREIGYSDVDVVIKNRLSRCSRKKKNKANETGSAPAIHS